MAAYFILINKLTGEADTFNSIDEAMCAHFNVKCDTEKYLYNWYNLIGFRLALSKSFDEICQELITSLGEETKNGNESLTLEYAFLLRITQWLKQHYTTDSWYRVGK